jgi:hypothetical protein
MNAWREHGQSCSAIKCTAGAQIGSTMAALYMPKLLHALVTTGSSIECYNWCGCEVGPTCWSACGDLHEHCNRHNPPENDVTVKRVSVVTV